MRKFLSLSLITLAILALVAAAEPAPSDTISSQYSIGRIAPALSGVDQYGRAIKLRGYRGKWVMLDFCTSWCPPCQRMGREVEPLKRFLAKHHVPFEYLSILREDVNFQPSKERDAVLWSLRNASTAPVLHVNGVQANAYQLPVRLYALAASTSTAPDHFYFGTPTVVLLDPQQRIRAIWPGETHPEVILRKMGEGHVKLPRSFHDSYHPARYDASITVGAGGGTFTYPPAEENANNDVSPLKPYAAFCSSVSTDDFTATWTLSYIQFASDTGSDVAPIAHDEAVGFMLSKMIWPGGKPTFPTTKAAASFIGPDGHTPVAPTEVTGAIGTDGSFSVSGLTAAGLGVPDDQVVTGLMVDIQALIPSPLARIQMLDDALAQLPLSPENKTRLATPLRAARLAIAPPVRKSVATAQLATFKSIVDELSGSALTVAEADDLTAKAGYVTVAVAAQP